MIPDSKKTLRACLRCGLVKSKKQWEIAKYCDNCGNFERIDPNENTSTGFQG